jgi:putative sigma-54 modulation protein
MKVQITAVHFDADQKLIDYIEKKASKLGLFFDKITDAQVFLKLENSGQVRDKIVELKLMVPGDLLIASDTSKTFEGATDGVVDNMKRQLTKYKERIQAKSHHPKASS